MDDRIIQIMDGNIMTYAELKAVQSVIDSCNSSKLHWKQVDVYEGVLVVTLPSGFQMKYKFSEDSGSDIKQDNRIVV